MVGKTVRGAIFWGMLVAALLTAGWDATGARAASPAAATARETTDRREAASREADPAAPREAPRDASRGAIQEPARDVRGQDEQVAPPPAKSPPAAESAGSKTARERRDSERDAPSQASQARNGQRQPEQPVEVVKTARRVLRQDGRDLPYSATVGQIPLKDDEGKGKATIFYTAYEAESPEGQGGRARADRPVTFCFNGGPGAASVWLHLGGLGPRLVALADDGRPLPPPTRLVDNDRSWLAFTDLVFVDPVGTGFSRASSKEEEKRFFNIEQDVRSVGEFIRFWLTRQGRWLSPKFLVGASYGTTRAAALTDWLHDAAGVDLNGVILVSPVLDFDTIMADGGAPLPDLLALPTYAATAWKHGRNGSELRGQPLDQVLARAEEYAVRDYATLLARGGPEGRGEKQAAALAGLTGLSAEYLVANGLFTPPGRFRKELLRDKGLVVGRMDTRAVGYALDSAAAESGFDPALEALLGSFSAGANQYLRAELGFESDLPYEFLSNEVNRAWDWSRSVRGQGYVSVSDSLARSMAVQTRLQVLMACGVFDLATPYFAVEHTVNRMGLPAPLRANIHIKRYAAGHMLYTDRAERLKLFDDVAAFFAATIGQRQQ